MVTVHRAYGFRFALYTNDHDPAHVHLLGHGGEAKVMLDPVSVVWAIGIPRAELRRLLHEVSSQQGLLMLKWKELHEGRP